MLWVAAVGLCSAVATLFAIAPAVAASCPTYLTIPSSAWTVSGATFTASGSHGFVAQVSAGQTYGDAQATIPVNLTQDPYLSIDVTSVAAGGSWNLTLGAPGPKMIQLAGGNTTQSGLHVYNLAQATKLSGQQQIIITFWPNGAGDAITVQDLQLQPLVSGCPAGTPPATTPTAAALPQTGLPLWVQGFGACALGCGLLVGVRRRPRSR